MTMRNEKELLFWKRLAKKDTTLDLEAVTSDLFYQDISKYCERIVPGGWTYNKRDGMVVPEPIYGQEGEEGFDGIVERTFVKERRYLEIFQRINSERKAEGKKEFTPMEFLLLAGYVFVDINKEKNKQKLTLCYKAACTYDRDYLYSIRIPYSGINTYFDYYELTESNGNKLSDTEVESVVKRLRDEIGRNETVNEIKRDQANQGDQR